MIYGIGTDIVEVARIEESLRQFGDAFAGKILAESELVSYRESHIKARFLAKRFAAKEAFAKAVGSGFRYPVILSHISVMHDGQGKPGLRFHPELELYLRKRNIVRHHLSLSDEKNLACAVVVLERS